MLELISVTEADTEYLLQDIKMSLTPNEIDIRVDLFMDPETELENNLFPFLFKAGLSVLKHLLHYLKSLKVSYII